MQKLYSDYYILLEDTSAPPQQKIIYFERLRMFFSSKAFMLLILMFSLLTYIFEKEVYGVVISLLLVSLILIFSSDIFPTYLPVLLAAMSALRMYDSYDIFIKYSWVLIIAVLSLLFYLITNKLQFKKMFTLKLFFPQLAVSVALILGGIGAISFKDYFQPTALYYVLGLGFGMLAAYFIFSTRINTSKSYDSKEKLAFAMFIAGSYAALMIFIQYALKVVPALLGPPFSYNIIRRYFPLSNNISTIILMVLPFSFYLALTKKRGLIYFVSGILQAVAMLISTSRSGFLLAFALTLPLVMYTLIKDKKNRTQYFICILILLSFLTGLFIVGYKKIWYPIFNNFAFNMKKDGKIYLMLALEFVIITVYFALLYKLKGKPFIIILTLTLLVISVGIIGAVIFREKIIAALIRMDYSRGKMAELALANFLKYPILGTGLGYTGTSAYYSPKPMMIGLYHCAPFQLLGLGVVGIVAYLYMLVSRIRLLRKSDSLFNYTIYFALIGLYLMSLLNPGIFIPFMFMLQFNLYFAISEQNLSNKAS